MNPSFIRLTFTKRFARTACRKGAVASLPQDGLARCSSCTDSPSDSQRGTLLPLTPNVKVCVNSCHSVEPQLYSPGGRAAGARSAMTGPKLTPNASNPASPTVRTEKSA